MSSSQFKLLPIVGIGASAGGLESLERFFDGAGDSLEAAFVVVQHLSPTHETMMDALLKRHTAMPVSIVTDGEAVRSRHVYVLPPSRELTIEGGNFRLHEQDRKAVPHLPIDRFFRSLAAANCDFRVAVVLSGTGSDGSRGIIDVHQQGGLVLAESETTAKFSGMPKAAMATGVVHKALPPEAMGAEIFNRLAAGGDFSQHLGFSEDEVDANAVQKLFRILKQHSSIDFAKYKPTTVTRRIDRRMGIVGIEGFGDYVKFVEQNPDEVDALYRDMLIGVTKFFRDPVVWELFDDEVADQLFERANPEKGVRVWVPGCATGKEAYSIAILLDEAKSRLGTDVGFKVFASDVHQDSLRHAAYGVYQPQTLTNVSATRLEKYFVRSNDAFVIEKELRSHVVFAPHNALQDPPFTDLDMVSCRNLLIYFDLDGQKRAITFFHFGLRQEGILLLGPSETVGSLTDEFRVMNDKFRIYQKRRNTRLTTNIQMPVKLEPKSLFDHISLSASAASHRDRIQRYDRMLAHIMPPTILVSSKRKVLETFGGAQRLLRIADGVFSDDLIDVVPKDLQAPVSALFRRAERDKTKVRLPLTGIRLDESEMLDIEVVIDPVPGDSEPIEMYLVQIKSGFTSGDTDERTLPDRDAQAAVVDFADNDYELAERVRTLESDLSHSRENLQATIEELESSNEELQATNEELISSNEELQSTNEELNSVNEELHTVNVEYQNKNAELRELNEDMNHLFASTDIGTVFLDEELRIRRFTPRIAPIFNLQHQDIGRSLDDFKHTLKIRELTELIEKALHVGEKTEREVADRHGNHFILRVNPYLMESTINGVVLTLTDISRLVEQRELVERFQRRLQQAIDAVPVFVSFVNSKQIYEYANSTYYKWFNLSESDVIGCHVRDVIGEWAYELSRPRIDAVLAGEPQQFDQLMTTANGPTNLTVSYVPAKTEKGKVTGFYVSAADVTGLKQAEREIQRAAEVAVDASRAKSDFLAKMSHEIRSPMTAILGFADILDEQLIDPDNRNAVEVIRENARHLLDLINDILDLSRIEAGKLELECSAFRLDDLLNECHNTVLPRAEKGDVALQIQSTLLEEDGTSDKNFVGDRRRLMQVILNLLTNAVKFSPKGSVRVQASRLSGHFNGQDGLQIEVQDDGCGIPEEQMKYLFEPFCQAENSNERRFEGTGLGLTITKQLIDQMGGQISVTSMENQGSTFTVQLPWLTTSRSRNSYRQNVWTVAAFWSSMTGEIYGLSRNIF